MGHNSIAVCRLYREDRDRRCVAIGASDIVAEIVSPIKFIGEYPQLINYVYAT